MADVSGIRAEVERNRSVDASAIALINGIAAKIDEAVAKAVADNDAVDLSALTDLSSELKSSSDALADAVSANTPAVEPPVV